MNTIVYEYGNELYINLTNRCQNRCTFCIRDTEGGIGTGEDLWLEHEPSADEVKGALKPYLGRDVVFCGYGEPTLCLDEIKEVSEFVHLHGGHTRLNTNGLANLEYGRDVTPELKGVIDYVSISLNAPNSKRYAELCCSSFGEAAFDAIIDFTKRCKAQGLTVRLTVVGFSLNDGEAEECAKIAKELGVLFRVR